MWYLPAARIKMLLTDYSSVQGAFFDCGPATLSDQAAGTRAYEAVLLYFSNRGSDHFWHVSLPLGVMSAFGPKAASEQMMRRRIIWTFNAHN
jgi:hypothetical protein